MASDGNGPTKKDYLSDILNVLMSIDQKLASIDNAMSELKAEDNG